VVGFLVAKYMVTEIAMMSTTAMKARINLCLTSLRAIEDSSLRALSVMPANSLTFPCEDCIFSLFLASSLVISRPTSSVSATVRSELAIMSFCLASLSFTSKYFCLCSMLLSPIKEDRWACSLPLNEQKEI
jgi:hypothetical protein